VNATPSYLSRALCQCRHCTRSQVTACRRLQNPRMESSPSSAAAAAVQPAFNARGGSSKEKGKTLLAIDAAAAAAAAISAASAEFEAAKVAVGKLKAKALVEVCQLKNAPPAVRQLLHAACAALGERVWQCVCVWVGGGGGDGVMVAESCPFPAVYFWFAGEPSHVLPNACLECMAAPACQQRLATLQSNSLTASAAADFTQHMSGYVQTFPAKTFPAPTPPFTLNHSHVT
jgi:hypothetical protein